MITCWFLICHVPWAYHNHRSYSRGTDWRRNGWETSESQLLITWTFIDPSSFCGIATSGTPPSPPSRAAALAIQSGTLTLAVTRRGDLAPWWRGMDVRRPRGRDEVSLHPGRPLGAQRRRQQLHHFPFFWKKSTTFSHFRTPFLMSCTFTASPPRVTSSSSAPLSRGHLSSNVHLIGRKWGLFVFQSRSMKQISSSLESREFVAPVVFWGVDINLDF